jgi:nitronate monooxygenase
MPIPASLNKNLALPVLCAPMFIASNPDLVIAQCKKDIWGAAGRASAASTRLMPAAELIARLKQEYRAAKAALCDSPY